MSGKPPKGLQSSAQKKLIADLQRLGAVTGDTRFEAAAEAATEHPTAFPSRGRKARSAERIAELDAMAHRATELAIGGLSFKKACETAVFEQLPGLDPEAHAAKASAVARHYRKPWRQQNGWGDMWIDDVKDMLS